MKSIVLSSQFSLNWDNDIESINPYIEAMVYGDLDTLRNLLEGKRMRHTIIEYAVGNHESGPYGITAGKDGAIWFTEQRAIISGE